MLKAGSGAADSLTPENWLREMLLKRTLENVLSSVSTHRGEKLLDLVACASYYDQCVSGTCLLAVQCCHSVLMGRSAPIDCCCGAEPPVFDEFACRKRKHIKTVSGLQSDGHYAKPSADEFGLVVVWRRQELIANEVHREKPHPKFYNFGLAQNYR